MIIDTARFVAEERPYWEELGRVLEQLKQDPERRLSFEEVQRLHYLYERCSADLSRVGTFSSEPRLRAIAGGASSAGLRADSRNARAAEPPLEEPAARLSAGLPAGTALRSAYR